MIKLPDFTLPPEQGRSLLLQSLAHLETLLCQEDSRQKSHSQQQMQRVARIRDRLSQCAAKINQMFDNKKTANIIVTPRKLNLVVTLRERQTIPVRPKEKMKALAHPNISSARQALQHEIRQQYFLLFNQLEPLLKQLNGVKVQAQRTGKLKHASSYLVWGTKHHAFVGRSGLTAEQNKVGPKDGQRADPISFADVQLNPVQISRYENTQAAITYKIQNRQAPQLDFGDEIDLEGVVSLSEVIAQSGPKLYEQAKPKYAKESFQARKEQATKEVYTPQAIPSLQYSNTYEEKDTFRQQSAPKTMQLGPSLAPPGSSLTPPPPLGSTLAPPPPLGSTLAPPPPLGSSLAPPPPLGSPKLSPPPPLGSSLAPPPPLGSFIAPPPPLGFSLAPPPPLGSSLSPPPAPLGGQPASQSSSGDNSVHNSLFKQIQQGIKLKPTKTKQTPALLGLSKANEEGEAADSGNPLLAQIRRAMLAKKKAKIANRSKGSDEDN